jgi:hypothetical protein
MPSCCGSLVITTKWKPKYIFHAAVTLFFYIPQKYDLNKSYFKHLLQHNFTVIHCVAVVSLLSDGFHIAITEGNKIKSTKTVWCLVA